MDEGPRVPQGVRGAGGGIRADCRGRQSAYARGPESGAIGQAHENDAEHDRAAGERARPALDANAGALRQGDGASAEDQLRAGEEEGVMVTVVVGWVEPKAKPIVAE